MSYGNAYPPPSRSSAQASGYRAGRGIPFAWLLGLLFIGLKLCHVISWSWLWVLSPFWVPMAAVALGVALFLAGALVFGAVKAVRR